MKTVCFVAAILMCSTAAWAGQDVTIPANIERLSAKATETVSVNVDGALLQIASKFLSSSDADQAKAKAIVDGLKGIYVRSFEFASPGAYSPADVESLRSQLRAPEWSKMVTVRSSGGGDGDNVDVFFKMDKGQIAGLVIIAAEPTELTFVNIVGPIDLEQLSSLGGQFGIPKVTVPPGAGPQK